MLCISAIPLFLSVSISLRLLFGLLLCLFGLLLTLWLRLLWLMLGLLLLWFGLLLTLRIRPVSYTHLTLPTILLV